MRIIIDARLYGQQHRGIGIYVRELVHGLAEIDQENEYILLVNPKARELPVNLPPNFSCQAAPWRVYTLAEQIKMPRLIKSLKPDVVHFTHFNVPFFTRARYVVSIHDLILHHMPGERATTLPKTLYWIKILFYRLVVRRAVRRAVKILVLTQAVANELVNFYPFCEEKIMVIPLGARQLPEAAKVECPDLFALTVGAAYPHKNLQVAIKAIGEARNSYPNLKLVIVGRKDGFMARLEKEVSLSGENSYVQFWGEASGAELAGLYKKAKVYLVPSLYEGFGLGALEALSYGTAVVASDIPVHREILQGIAALAHPTIVTQWVKHLLNILSGGFDARGDIALKRLQEYTWAKTVVKTQTVYKIAIEG